MPPAETLPPVLPGIERETGAHPARCVIWLHGLGADGHDFAPIVDALDLSGLPAIRFIFPHAPTRPVTINGGYIMRAWYDIVSTDFAGRREDPNGVEDSAALVEAMIERENRRGIASHHIVLAGFSQGGAIALHTGLRHARPLAGIMALSTYVPLADALPAEANAANQETPIFMAHGLHDAVIPHAFGKRSGDLLVQRGHSVEWHDYPAEHTVTMDEVTDIGAWLQRVLA